MHNKWGRGQKGRAGRGRDWRKEEEGKETGRRKGNGTKKIP